MGINADIRDFSFEAFRNGDEQEFEELFRVFFPPLCYFGESFLSDTAAAQDIASNTLLKVWQKRADFKSFLHIKAFLYRATKNACIDVLKQADRSRSRQEYYYSDDQDADSLSKIIEAEILGRLYNAINTLPEQCRKIIQLSYVEGWKTDEIAREMNLSESTIRAQKARGIKLLKKILPPNMLSLLLML